MVYLNIMNIGLTSHGFDISSTASLVWKQVSAFFVASRAPRYFMQLE